MVEIVGHAIYRTERGTGRVRKEWFEPQTGKWLGDPERARVVFGDEDQARRVCAQLNAQGVFCAVSLMYREPPPPAEGTTPRRARRYGGAD